ncbi:cytochrome P450 [Kitasatospora sp. NPDC089797]|uniref:cytochrome P450 n=1 Tax=Kitasatospora sp. NPDC089797 TaxID=3155298 RepID=UPI003438929A
MVDPLSLPSALPGPAPAPGAWPVLGHVPALVRDPAKWLAACRRTGDIVQVDLGTRRVHLLCSPRLVNTVLVVQAERFDKGGPLYERATRILGKGLFTATGGEHRCQRCLIQPSFTPACLDSYARAMHQEAAALADSWRPHQEVDVLDAMHTLTAAVLRRARWWTGCCASPPRVTPGARSATRAGTGPWPSCCAGARWRGCWTPARSGRPPSPRAARANPTAKGRRWRCPAWSCSPPGTRWARTGRPGCGGPGRCRPSAPSRRPWPATPPGGNRRWPPSPWSPGCGRTWTPPGRAWSTPHSPQEPPGRRSTPASARPGGSLGGLAVWMLRSVGPAGSGAGLCGPAGPGTAPTGGVAV